MINSSQVLVKTCENEDIQALPPCAQAGTSALRSGALGSKALNLS